MTKNRLLLLVVLFLVSKSFGQEIDIVTQERIQGTITILSYSPDGKLIASGSERENSIKIWDVVSGKIIGKLEGHEAATTALQFNENGTALISAAMDKKVILWNLTNWKLIDSLTVSSPVKTFTNNPTSANSFFREMKREMCLNGVKLHLNLQKGCINKEMRLANLIFIIPPLSVAMFLETY